MTIEMAASKITDYMNSLRLRFFLGMMVSVIPRPKLYSKHPWTLQMKNIFAMSLIGLLLILRPSLAIAGDEDIWGTYKLISSTDKYLDTGNIVNSFGEHPKGYITYGKEGRMMVLVTYDGRKTPQDRLKTSIEERDALYRSMFAYGGTYSYSGNRIEHHIDISASETQNGTTLIRYVTTDGDRLIYATEPFPTLNEETLGKMIVRTLIWEKVR
jgi:hypothetical protein